MRIVEEEEEEEERLPTSSLFFSRSLSADVSVFSLSDDLPIQP
jgi:hypothetical protein